MKRVKAICCVVVACFLQDDAPGQTAGGSATGITDHAKHPWALRQMLFMLRDRPKMAQYPLGNEMRWVLQGDSIWQWAAARFAGSGTGFWIGWDEDPPTDDFEADHSYRWDRGWIRIQDKTQDVQATRSLEFEHQWSCLVFEFFNQENAGGFSKLTEDALNGKMSRDEYILGVAKLEHIALRKSIDFYASVWSPWCHKSGFKSDPLVWTRNFLPKFEDWIAQYPRASRYPWRVYGNHFDWAVSIRTNGKK